jgi:hypothetical protein
MTIRALQRLLMILGGKVAADFRAIVEGTFTRVMAGDQSLIEVINANAASTAPLQQAYRSALEQEPVVPVLDEYCLGQKREREELDIAERRLRLEQGTHELEASKRDKAMEHTSKAVALIKSFTTIDERTKLQFEDHVKNIILSSSQSFFVGGRALSNGKTESPSPNASISISCVAAQLGYRPSSNDAKRIGGEVRKRYIEVHNKPPPKHDQLCDGRVTSVNSYTEYDRALVEEALHSYFSLTESDEDNTYDPCEVAARELSY